MTTVTTSAKDTRITYEARTVLNTLATMAERAFETIDDASVFALRTMMQAQSRDEQKTVDGYLRVLSSLLTQEQRNQCFWLAGASGVRTSVSLSNTSIRAWFTLPPPW